MKIKCKQIINHTTHEQKNDSYWLTIGKEYIVLEIIVYSNKNEFLIVDDSSNKDPHLHDAKQFEVISHYIPSNWEINKGDPQITILGPKAWNEPDFWDKCYDGDEESLKIYKKEAQTIVAEENGKT